MLGPLALQVSKPAWAMAEFRDLKSERSNYGRVAAADVASWLAKIGAYDIVPIGAAEWSAARLGLRPPLKDGVGLSRVGQDIQAGTIVLGEVVDYRTRKMRGVREVRVALRVLVYDVATGALINGALEEGIVDSAGPRAGDAEPMSEALGQAAAIAVRTLRGQVLPEGSIVGGGTGYPVIDQGGRAGFRLGDRVTVSRGATLLELGRIARCEPDRAEVTLEGVLGSFALGDRVRAVYVPPLLPPKGRSVFDANPERMGHRHRRPWWRLW